MELYKRTVGFIDEHLQYFEVELEITDRNGYPKFTACGNGANGIGQCQDAISPRTESQKRLLEYWEAHHLKKIEEGAENDLDKLIHDICAEEDEWYKSLGNYVYLDSNITKERLSELVPVVEDLLECDEDDAACFLAIGLEIGGITVGALAQNFEIKDEIAEYQALGYNYVASKYQNVLDEKAIDRLMDDDYLWKRDVQADLTILGLYDWAKEFVDINGFASVLDGCYFEHRIDGEWVIGCRV